MWGLYRRAVAHGARFLGRQRGTRITQITIDGRVVHFAVGQGVGDPIANALAEGQFPGDPVNQLWRHLIKSGSNAIDIGAHLGIYALPAAAAGAHVIAIEASPKNAALLDLAIKRNGFSNLRLLKAVASAKNGNAAFISLGPYGHVASSEELANGGADLRVSAVAVEDVINETGWNKVDLVKIDVEGSELAAMEGMETILAHEKAPLLLVEANAHMLQQYGNTPKDLLAEIEGYGYRCYLIDSTSPGRLVPVSMDGLQSECVADYLAFKSMPNLDPWWIDRPLNREEVIQRVIKTTETYDAYQIHRTYGERLIQSGPSWLREDPSVQGMLHALQSDVVGSSSGSGTSRSCRKPLRPVANLIDVPAHVGDRQFRLALPADSDDPVVAAYAEGEPLNSYLTDMLVRFAPKGATVLDLGCHVGTFAVAAAALGYRVVAVDASPLHVEAVRRSADLNELDRLIVVHAAVADRARVVRFHLDGLFGTVLDDVAPVEDSSRAIEVDADSVVALLARVNIKLDELAFIKMDVEGSELAALTGIAEFLAGPSGPPVLYESNELTSRPKGFSVEGLRTALEVLGYRTYRKEGEDLFECPPLEPQPEAWVDLMALKERHLAAAGIAPSGRWPSESLVDRIVTWGKLEHANVRLYVAELLLSHWSVLPRDPRISDLISTLAEDPEPEVRATVSPLLTQPTPVSADRARLPPLD